MVSASVRCLANSRDRKEADPTRGRTLHSRLLTPFGLPIGDLANGAKSHY